MTPLRFRAWHKKEKILARVMGFHFDESDPDANMIHVDLYPESPSWMQSDCVVMQSTGLHDKNGKEIFQGDLIRDHDDALCEVVWPEKYVTGDNEDILAWCLNPLDKPFGLRGLDVQSIYEVIGNVYEHPSLLDK